MAVDEQERFLVFEQTKYASPGITLAPVGGYIQPGEAPLDAAKRELLEEMGCRSDNWIDLGCFATDANRGNGKGYYFLAKNAQKVDQTAVSDDLEEQELLILSASNCRKPRCNQGQNHHLAGSLRNGAAASGQRMMPTVGPKL